jgi:hypothetical protein
MDTLVDVVWGSSHGGGNGASGGAVDVSADALPMVEFVRRLHDGLCDEENDIQLLTYQVFREETAFGRFVHHATTRFAFLCDTSRLGIISFNFCVFLFSQYLDAIVMFGSIFRKIQILFKIASVRGAQLLEVADELPPFLTKGITKKIKESKENEVLLAASTGTRCCC